MGGTYGVEVAAGAGVGMLSVSVFGAVSVLGAVSTFVGAFIVFVLVRGFSSDTAVVDCFAVFDFDFDVAVGTKCTDTGFG